MSRRHKNKSLARESVRNIYQDKKIHEIVDKLLALSTLPQQNIQTEIESCGKMMDLINEVRERENSCSSGAKKNIIDCPRNETKIEKFIDWATENGAKFDGCEIASFPGYDFGLRAATDFHKNSLFVTVPRSMMMTTENAETSELKTLIKKDKLLQSMPNVLLAIFLLLEKFKENSFWQPYIEILPQDYTTVLYFDAEDLKELQGSPTLELALKQIKNCVRQYSYFYKVFSISNDVVAKIMQNKYTFDEYRWAVSTIMTRQNFIPSQDTSHFISTLIPFWDFLNHTNGQLTTVYNPILNQSECSAVRDFTTGEQLLIFYGTRTNMEFFLHNGFVYEENENDSYILTIGLSKSDPQYEIRTRLLKRFKVTNKFYLNTGPFPISDELIAFSRIFNMNEDQLLRGFEKNDLKEIVDEETEKKSWNFLQVRLQLILASYKTSLDEDLASMKEATSNPVRLISIKMRYAEKKILLHALNYIKNELN